MGRVRLCPCYLGTALASGHFPGELKACDRAREALTVGRRGAAPTSEPGRSLLPAPRPAARDGARWHPAARPPGTGKALSCSPAVTPR